MVPNRRRRRRRHERKGKSDSFRVRSPNHPRAARASHRFPHFPSPSSLSPLAEVTHRNALIPNESRVSFATYMRVDKAKRCQSGSRLSRHGGNLSKNNMTHRTPAPYTFPTMNTFPSL